MRFLHLTLKSHIGPALSDYTSSIECDSSFFHHVIPENKFELAIAVDTSEVIYDFKISKNNYYQQEFLLLSKHLLNTNIHEALEKLSSLSNEYNWDLFLLNVKAVIDAFLCRNISEEKKIMFCPCQNISQKEIKSKIVAFQGNKKMVIKQTMATIFCELCADSLNENLENFWREKVLKCIEDFQLYAPFDASSLNIILVELNDKNYKLGVNGTEVNESQLRAIENYFTSEVSLNLVEVVRN